MAYNQVFKSEQAIDKHPDSELHPILADEDFQDAIANTVDEFWGNAPEAGIF